MKIYRQIYRIILLLLAPIILSAQPYPLQVQVIPKANFTPYLRVFKENPSEYISLKVSSTGAGNSAPKNIYFAIKMQQLTPRRDVSFNTNYQKKPLVPTVINIPGSNLITPTQMKNAFDGYLVSDFIYTGIGEIDFFNIASGLRLPEGIYQLCFIAVDFDTPPDKDPVFLSDPNTSCAQITICYSGSQPQILQPVNTIIQPESNYIKKKIEPKQVLLFQWLAPTNTCGLNMSSITYDINITNLLEGQTEEDASKINPPLIRKENLKITSLSLDTNFNKNIFNKGETYVFQVIAKSNNPAIELQNEGKSKVCSFVYGEKDTIKTEKKEEKEDKPIRLAVSNIDCGVKVPDNTTSIDNLEVGDEVTIGDFTMRIAEVSKKGEKYFKGKGVIRESIIGKFEYFNWINLIVEFDSISVNTDKQVIGGYAVGSYGDSTLNTDYTQFFSSFYAKAGGWYDKFFKKKVDGLLTDTSGKAQTYIKKFKQEIKLGSQLVGLSAQTLPMKVEYVVDGYNINLAVSDMKFTPKGSAFSIIYFLDIPEVNQSIPFGMSDVCMDGNPVANGKFALLGDAEIPLGEKSHCKLFIAGGENNTYIKWSKKGFEGISLAAKVKIEPESGIISVNKNNKTVDIDVRAEFVSWDDWTADISVEDFKLKDYPDFTFGVKKATYDHSTKKDPSGYKKVIKEIKEKDKNFKTDDEFKGLFFEEIEFGIPNYFTGSKADEPFKFSVNNAFYDSKGFTFVVGLKNIIDLKTGKLGGWGFSMDTLQMLIVQNSFREGRMNGKIILPLTEDGSAMTYSSVLSNKKGENMKFEFNINPTINYKFLKYFTAQIDQTSYINVKVEEKNKKSDVTVTANLNGNLSASASLGNDKKSDGDGFKLEVFAFKDMYFANKDSSNKPDFVFNIGDWGLFGSVDVPEEEKEKEKEEKPEDKKKSEKSEGKIAGFDYKISDPTFKFEKAGALTAENLKKYTYLSGKTKEDLVKAAENGSVISKKIKIGLPIEIYFGTDATMTKGYATPYFEFDVAFDYKFNASPALYDFDFSLPEVGVKGTYGPVHLEGSINIFEDDETFGNGFRGAVKCKFPMDIMASATVQFGKVKKEGMKAIDYFYVDGAINLGDAASIPIAYPVALSGFGGGVWKNMQIQNDDRFKCKIPEVKKDKNGNTTFTEASETEFSNLTKTGASVSGLKYVPVPAGETAFGMRAEIYLAADKSAGGSKMLNGVLSIAATTKNSKFEEISFKGIVNAIGDGKGTHVVTAAAEIKYNHPSKQFALDVNVKAEVLKFATVNIPFKLHVDGKEKKWTLGIGEPNYNDKDKCISFDAGFDIKIVKAKLWAKGYILGGNKMEDFKIPDLPDRVKDVLRISRDKPMPPTEKGFMLGMRASFDFNFEFGPLYALLETEIGFDLAVMDRAGMLCSNGDKIGGINGYYCNGQIYGYLHGDIGVQLNFFGKKKRFSLVSVTAGAAMKAGLIDPTWIKGVVGVQGSILGGLIKFKTNAKFSVGKRCDILGDPLKDLVIVESVSPGVTEKSEVNSADKKTKEASVFVAPKVACNVVINKEFKLQDDPTDKESVMRTYKFTFNKARTKIINLDNPSEEVLFRSNTIDELFKAGKSDYTIKTEKMLKPFTNYQVVISVDMREIINNKSVLPVDDKGKKYTAEEARKEYKFYFKTGHLPDYIDRDNIVDAYPMDRQYEVFSKNGQKGYIYLAYSQEYLIKNRDLALGKDALFGQFINVSDKLKAPVSFHYRFTNKNGRSAIEFDMKDLIPKNIYNIRFYVVNKKQEDAKFAKKEKTTEIGANSKALQDEKEVRNNQKESNTQLLGSWDDPEEKLRNYINRQSRYQGRGNRTNNSTNKITNIFETNTEIRSINSEARNFNETRTVNFRRPTPSAESLAIKTEAPHYASEFNENKQYAYKLVRSKGNFDKHILTSLNEVSSTTTMEDKITGEKSSSSDKLSDKSTKQDSIQNRILQERSADIKNIFEYHFRVSQYKNIEEKMAKIRLERNFNQPFIVQSPYSYTKKKWLCRCS